MLCPTVPPLSLYALPHPQLPPQPSSSQALNKAFSLVSGCGPVRSLLGTVRLVYWVFSLQPSSFTVFMKSALRFFPSPALTQYVVCAPGQKSLL